MRSHIEYSELLDIYGDLLTKKQRDVMELSVNEDLSLAEIAEDLKISRQACQDSIKKAEQKLDEYEEILKISEKNEKMETVLQELENLKDTDGLKAYIDRLRAIITEE